VGFNVLGLNTTGSTNTAVGYEALGNTTGGDNIGIGNDGGYNLTTGSGNIDIGNAGVAGESNTIRLGDSSNQTTTFIAGIRDVTTGQSDAIPVVIDSTGQLGTAGSSLPVGDGGTGGTTAAAARTNLGAAASGANGDITSLTGLTTAVPGR
jgi:trimeric autotransporter adhesin